MKEEQTDAYIGCFSYVILQIIGFFPEIAEYPILRSKCDF